MRRPHQAGRFWKYKEAGESDVFIGSKGRQYVMSTKDGRAVPTNEVGGSAKGITGVIENTGTPMQTEALVMHHSRHNPDTGSAQCFRAVFKRQHWTAPEGSERPAHVHMPDDDIASCIQGPSNPVSNTESIELAEFEQCVICSIDAHQKKRFEWIDSDHRTSEHRKAFNERAETTALSPNPKLNGGDLPSASGLHQQNHAWLGTTLSG